MMDAQLRAMMQSFVPFTDSEAEIIGQAFAPKKIAAKDFLLKAGEVCHFASFIKTGLLRYYYTHEGKEIVGNFFFENSFVADFQSFITQQPALQNIDAIEAAELLCVSHDEWQHLFQKIPAMQQFGRLSVERIFVYSQQRSASLLLDTAEERYLKLMKQRPKVLQRVPQYMIASYLGITPESLSRIRRRIAGQ